MKIIDDFCRLLKQTPVPPPTKHQKLNLHQIEIRNRMVHGISNLNLSEDPSLSVRVAIHYLNYAEIYHK